MVYKTVSSSNIIARVLRDLKPSSTDWVTDAIEWLGEVVERIGCYPTLERKTVTVTARGYKIPYPIDLESIEYISHNKQRLFFGGGNFDITHDSFYPNAMNLVYAYSTGYYLTGNAYVTCSIEGAEVEICYNAFPLDEEGYPLIPDNYFYKTACFWYIASRLALREQIKLKYEDCETKFNTNASLAENDCAFPSPERMDNFRERWCRLVPNVALGFRDNVALPLNERLD